MLTLIVALQTISDYLDNLCDRAGITNELAFRQLHLAVTDALNPHTPLHDYYRHYPYRDDNGYLTELVETCRRQTTTLPSYAVVKADILQLATLYSDLQSLKHLLPEEREAKLLAWSVAHLRHYPGISAWEFAAASGSTLAIFMLCAAAANPFLSKDSVKTLLTAYFPWICGLHILLDYYIDYEEDTRYGDLNFINYYHDEDTVKQRLQYFTREAYRQSQFIQESTFTQTIVSGLLALYLSDHKAASPQGRRLRKILFKEAGEASRNLYLLCRLLRLIALL